MANTTVSLSLSLYPLSPQMTAILSLASSSSSEPRMDPKGSLSSSKNSECGSRRPHLFFRLKQCFVEMNESDLTEMSALFGSLLTFQSDMYFGD